MRFYDRHTDREITTRELFEDWKTFRAEEPELHEPTFTGEFYYIILATIYRENDAAIIGTTREETERLLQRIRSKL